MRHDDKPNGAAYNLKTHSAFKLSTMATGYKVSCRCLGGGGLRDLKV